MTYQLDFTPENHEYRLNGEVVPSVTQLLAPIYSGVFDAIPADVLERKRALGTAVHKACELDDVNELDESTLHDAIRPYLDGWRRFRDEFAPVWDASEWMLADPGMRYAGTIDRVGTLNDGRLVVLDIKTGPQSPQIGVQLAGYERLLKANNRTEDRERLSVHLTEGGFQLARWTAIDDHRCFLALLSVRAWAAKYNGSK
jgi:hypothetical protein